MHGTVQAAIAAIAGLAAASHATSTIDPDSFQDGEDICAIHQDYEDGMAYLAAYAAEGVEGEYVFSLRGSSAGGSADIMQSGDVMPGDGPTFLGELAVDASGSYEASLQLYTTTGEFICRALV